MIMFSKIHFVFLLVVVTFMPVQAKSFRPIAEYQGALIEVMSSFLSPANQVQASAINSTLLSDNVVIRGG